MALNTCDVIVLGGGPAGVATALEVAERGHQVALLERAPRTGGMAGSFDCDGMNVDFGSHRLHAVASPAVLYRLRGLLGEDLQVRHRRGRLRLFDRWVEFPLQPADLVRSMPIGWLAAVARDAVTSPVRSWRDSGEHSYAGSLRRSLGPTVYDTLYAPYALKLWGLPGERIDAEQARVRVSADTAAKVAARVLRRSAEGILHRARLARAGSPGESAPTAGRHTEGRQPPGATFMYPRHGFGQITEALDRAAQAVGVQIHTSTTVTAITPGQVTTVSTKDGASWQAPTVLSTLPIPLLARLCQPTPPDHVVADARGLRFRAMVLVYLTHATPRQPPRGTPIRWSTYDAHYLPGVGTPVTRISEPANYRDSSDDPSDRSVICAEIPCAIDDDIWRADDAQLSAIVHAAIAEFDLPPLHCVGMQVRRLPSVYPIYEQGFSARLARLEAWADGIPGVTTLGRSGLFAHDNTHHAFEMARAAASALGPGGRLDAARWRASRESFRGHVVED